MSASVYSARGTVKSFEVIAQSLVDSGIDTVFGVMGEGNFQLLDALVKRNIKYVAAAREDGAVMMADGYARASGRLSVATVTCGPGLTNTLTALAEAAASRTPMLLVAGDTPTGVLHPLQDIDQRVIVEATGAGFHQLRSAHTTAEDVAVAVKRAFDERLPIVLNSPIDIQVAKADVSKSDVAASPMMQRPVPDHDALDRAVGILASARRPIIIAGKGAVLSDAHDSVLRLAQRLGAPLATSLMAKDFFVGDPFNLGVMGTLAADHVARTVAQADCLLVLGAGLNSFTTAEGSLLEGKSVVQCDIEPAAIGRWAPVAAGIVGDVSATADALHKWLGELGSQPTGFASEDLKKHLESHNPRSDFKDQSNASTVDVRTFALWLEDQLQADRTVVSDGGHFALAPLRHLRVPEPRASIYTAFGFGSIGLGLAAAVGASIAHPERPCVAVVGDGGFMMSLQEFSTAVQHELDLIVVVMNDQSYGVEYHKMLQDGLDPALSCFQWPEFADVGTALGGTGVTVRTLSDLGKAAAVLQNRNGPVLVDVKVDPAARIGWVD